MFLGRLVELPDGLSEYSECPELDHWFRHTPQIARLIFNARASYPAFTPRPANLYIMVRAPTDRDSLSQVFDAISHRYRRRLLVALLEHDPQVKDNPRRSSVKLSGDTIVWIDDELVQPEMYHNHLPKLEGLGYIAWDRDDGKIARGPNWEEVEPLVRLLHEHQDDLPGSWI